MKAQGLARIGKDAEVRFTQAARLWPTSRWRSPTARRATTASARRSGLTHPFGVSVPRPWHLTCSRVSRSWLTWRTCTCRPTPKATERRTPRWWHAWLIWNLSLIIQTTNQHKSRKVRHNHAQRQHRKARALTTWMTIFPSGGDKNGRATTKAATIQPKRRPNGRSHQTQVRRPDR